jgi:hypothetical protein
MRFAHDNYAVSRLFRILLPRKLIHASLCPDGVESAWAKQATVQMAE